MNTPFDKLQIQFHKDADHKRFRNRIQNEFIKDRELRLAKSISETFGDDIKCVLEVGCGEGSNYIYLNNTIESLNYVGVDFSFSKILFFGQAFPETPAVQANALALPFADKSFDGVLCRDLLHHVNNDRSRVISEAARVTRPGGKILIIEANGNTLLNKFFRILFPAERGMADSTPKKLVPHCSGWGRVELHFLEASQLTRAVGFVMGWPRRLKFLVYPIYLFCDIVERILARVLRREWWAYYMVTIRIS